MSPLNGMKRLQCYLIVIWTLLVTSSGVVISPSQCLGQPNNFLTSSEDYRDLVIQGPFSSIHQCVVVIQTTDCDSGIEVTYYRGNIVYHYDSMEFYDGPSAQYPSLGKYTRARYSHEFPGLEPRRSSGRFVTVDIRFPQYSHNNRDFRLRFRKTPRGLLPSNAGNDVQVTNENAVSDTCGEVTLIAYQKPNFITSPGYPREYSNSLDCKWKIISDDTCNDDVHDDVIQITIHALAIEETYDHLVIYDGETEFDPVLTKLSGHEEPRVIMASGHSVVIEFKTDDTAPGRGFHLAYSRARATPLLSQAVSIKKSHHLAEMSIDFITSTQHRAVYWSKDDVIIPADDRHTLTVTPTKVTGEPEPDVSVDGFRATLRISDPNQSDFGMYKVAVANDFGISERNVLLGSGQSVPILHNYTVFPENASIIVTFSSNPNFEVEWYNIRRLLSTGSDVVVTTTPVENNENANDNNMYTSVLRPEIPTDSDYGEFMCVIRNDVGTAEIYIHLDFPDTELPKLLVKTSAVELDDKRITLSVNFDSNIAYPTATWYHGDVLLGTSDKYNPGIKWKGIASSDWLTNEYPPALNARIFRRIPEPHADQLNSSFRFRLPTIGGSRLTTPDNANYTAVLTVSGITPSDFGLYKVVLENEAGVTEHAIDVMTPEVFPYVTCDQADAFQLVCNVTSCSAITQSWLHSVNGNVIRSLPGHQVGTVNTLIIPMCMHSDAGTYTCVAREQGTGSDVTINHDKATVTVRAVPVILESNVYMNTDHLQIEVPFYSHPLHHRIRWQLNGRQIGSSNQSINTEPRDVYLPMHGKNCSQLGYVTTVSVPDPQDEDYGVYKITVVNDLGNAEHFVTVQNPKYANPVSSSDVNVTYNEGSALLNVTFSSYYSYVSVKWYFRSGEVRENHPVNKYVIQTDPADDVIDQNSVMRTKRTKSTMLTVTCVTDDDYGMYDVLVTNMAGKAVIPVKLARHEQGIPKIVGEIETNISSSKAELSALFHSPSSHRLITWLKGDQEIRNDSLKYLITNENFDVEIPSGGEKVETTGIRTRLSVTSLDEKDYGVYNLQVYNDIGMTDHSVTLTEECGKK